MAKSQNNEVMFGARGKVGNLVVFKRFANNQTVIAKLQKRVENPVYTADQEAVKERFREAVIYARGIVQDPDLLAIYKKAAKPGASAYNMALADYCKPPQIKVIDLNGYQGAIGDQIRIRAVDNFFVSKVTLSIFDQNGVLVESGNAVQSANSVDWFYQGTTAIENISTVTFRAGATDRPGNTTVLEAGLPIL